MAQRRTDAARPRRARSARYPGVGLEECVAMCRLLADKGLDDLPATALAAALGHRNVRTNSFSARLSAARQFGLFAWKAGGYSLTPLAHAILAQQGSPAVESLYCDALRRPPLYAELIGRFEGKPVPDAHVLAGVIEKHYPITSSAKEAAGEVFLASARFAGALGDDRMLRLRPTTQDAAGALSHEIQMDLPLWGPDEGKTIHLRAPAQITPASFERFLQAVRLHVRVAEPPGRKSAES